MMYVATFLQVERIARCCELFIEERVDIKNAIEVRAFAHRFNRVRLLNHVDRHICDNFTEVRAFASLFTVVCAIVAVAWL